MRPTDEKQLAEAVASAKGPLRIVGGGSRQGLGNHVVGEVLETGGLSGITLYEPGALTVVAKAGTPVAEIEKALAAEGQRLAFEPMDHRGIFGSIGAPTIGGVAACNISGPRRIQVGACRDFMLGVRFVDGQGQVIKNGGRVMKNVTGYDLVKLMAGSYGTLGVLTEVSLKVLPAPETVATIRLYGLSDEKAGQAMRAAMASPFDVSGAAHDPNSGSGPVTYIRVEGFAKSVAYRTEKLKDVLAAFGAETCVSDNPGDWDVLRDAGNLKGDGDIWRISVKPSDGPEVASRLEAEAHFFDWCGGLLWARVASGLDVRDRFDGFEGHATLVHGSDETKARFGVFQRQGSLVERISNGLREKFDPRGILNAGLMG